MVTRAHSLGTRTKPTLALLLCLSLVCTNLAAQWTHYFPQDTSARCLRLTFTGDIMQHIPQIEAAQRGFNQFDYDPAFAYIAPYLQQSDVTLGNLELTLGGRPYSGYPCFSAPDTLLYSLKRAGFTALTTANNHTCDRKTAGIKRTIEQLEAANMPFTGTFRNAEERDSLTPRIIEKNGLRMALLAYTYGTNGIPFAAPVIVNLIDTVQMLADLQKAKKVADFVVVAVHWGIEYQDAPSAEQRKVADFLLRNGATLIVGNHPHVVQPLRLVYDTDGTLRQLCIYSMGNFISAQQTFPRAGSMLVHTVVEKNAKGIALRIPQYLLTYVDRPTIAGKRAFRVVPIEGQTLQSNSYAERYRQHAEKILAATKNEVASIHRRILPFIPPEPLPFPLFTQRALPSPTIRKIDISPF